MIRPSTIYGLGLAGLGLASAWVLFGGDPATPSQVQSLLDTSLGSDGRCTGFPGSFLRWDWNACCQVHDAGGSDITLASCILEKTPVQAAPLVFFAVGLMTACRPIYNLGQRWRIWK